MKNKLISFALAALLSLQLVACADTKVINGTEYDTYGILSEDDVKNPTVAYKPCWGNVFWGIVLVETIIAPIYFFGYSLFEPVGAKPAVQGAVPQ